METRLRDPNPPQKGFDPLKKFQTKVKEGRKIRISSRKIRISHLENWRTHEGFKSSKEIFKSIFEYRVSDWKEGMGIWIPQVRDLNTSKAEFSNYARDLNPYVRPSSLWNLIWFLRPSSVDDSRNLLSGFAYQLKFCVIGAVNFPKPYRDKCVILLWSYWWKEFEERMTKLNN